MKMLTTQLENDIYISINCKEVAYVRESHVVDRSVVMMSNGDLLTVKMPYLEVIGFMQL